MDILIFLAMSQIMIKNVRNGKKNAGFHFFFRKNFYLREVTL